MNWDTSNEILISSFCLAAGFVILRAAVTRRKHEYTLLWMIPGKGKFDVKSSWVSNTTLFGAILAIVLKDVKELNPPPDSGVLNLLFAALALVAVLVYVSGVTAHKDDDKDAWYEGYVATYLLSSFVALWASFGQLLSLGRIVQSAPKRILPAGAETVFLLSLLVGAVALLFYAWNIIRLQLESARKAGQGPPIIDSVPRRDYELAPPLGKKNTRASLAGALAIGASLFAACPAAIGDWRPSKTVEIVIASSPGAGTDRTGRWIQKLMSENKLIEVPVSVVNKPGGGTMVAVSYLGQHAGDGHFFLVISTPIVTSHIIGRSSQTHVDMTPLAILGTEPIVFAVRADSPIKSASDLADRFKADAASVTVGFANALGNQNHLAVAKVVRRLDGNVKAMKAVVFNGSGDVTTALLGGHVDLAITSGSALVSHVASGKVRALAMSAGERVGGTYASVPTWKELGIDAVTTNWRAAVGPRAMTEEQVAFWNDAFARLVQLSEWKLDMEKLLVTNLYLNSRGTRRFLDAEYAAFSSFLTEVGLARKP